MDEQVDVPFKTIYVSDNTLPAGESVVDEEGSPDKLSVLSVSYRNGKEIGRTIVSEHKITDAVNRVVRVGNATPIVETTELVDETSQSTTILSKSFQISFQQDNQGNPGR
ncbi:MAG: G5 domain-containing protein [Streptococcus sp.]